MFKKILVPVEHSDPKTWAKSLPIAVDLAAQHGAELLVMSVIPEIIRLPNLPANYGEGAKEHVEGVLKQAMAEAGAAPKILVEQGSVYREILKAAHANKVDLIVLASPKGDFPDYPLGPNAARVTRHANCSVFIVRG